MSWRNFIRWVALAFMIAAVLFLAPSANRNFRAWQETERNDPSAADLYRTELWFDASGIAAALVIGSLIFFGLKAGNNS